MDGIVSRGLPSQRAFFLFTNEKNAFDSHEGRLLGDCSFEHTEQMSKWMDLRASPIFYILFDQRDIKM